MTLLFDFDDVMTDLLSPWIYELNKKYGLHVKYDDVTSWDLKESFPMLSDQQIYKPLTKNSFWDSVQPQPNSQYILSELSRSKTHKIFIVTNTHYKNLQAKCERVLFKHFAPFVTWEDVIVTAHKEMVRGDLMVDDYINNLIGFHGIKVLFDQPYNRTFENLPDIDYRVYGWKGILELITDIDSKKLEHASKVLEEYKKEEQ